MSIEQVIGIVANVAKTDTSNLDPGIEFEKIENWDSMNYVNLILEIEQQFGLSLPLEKIPELRTIKQLTEYIVSQSS